MGRILHDWCALNRCHAPRSASYTSSEGCASAPKRSAWEVFDDGDDGHHSGDDVCGRVHRCTKGGGKGRGRGEGRGKGGTRMPTFDMYMTTMGNMSARNIE